METEIHGYNCDGDPEGLKFLRILSAEEWETLRYCADIKGEANFYDSYNKRHYELTKSGDGIYMVSEVKPTDSGWF